ncbi:hypothetical protein GCM10027612_64720 [Microbispora bryophytorum subsp. camponoti]
METVVAEIAPVAAAGERAAVAAVTGEAAPRVFTRQVPVPPRPGVPAWTMLAAFGAGAGVALGSAVIGWLLGRQGRRR